MKKLIIAIVAVFSSLSFSPAKAENRDSNLAYVIILTECGTKHQVPAGLGIEELEVLLNYYTAVDCYGEAGV